MVTILFKLLLFIYFILPFLEQGKILPVIGKQDSLFEEMPGPGQLFPLVSGERVATQELPNPESGGDENGGDESQEVAPQNDNNNSESELFSEPTSPDFAISSFMQPSSPVKRSKLVEAQALENQETRPDVELERQNMSSNEREEALNLIEKEIGLLEKKFENGNLPEPMQKLIYNMWSELYERKSALLYPRQHKKF